jgi:hypothetical protein
MDHIIKPLKQRGQSLVLSLILMSFAAMTILYSYNTSKLNIESTKLQHTADNAAYSVATIAARDFNFKAYTNRASVANQVAIAQMVGLSSWFSMTDQFATNACTYLCGTPYLGQVVSAIKSAVGSVNNMVQPVFEAMITAENIILNALSASQSIIHFAGAASAMDVADKVIEANDDRSRIELMQNPLLVARVSDVWFRFQNLHTRSSRASRGEYFKDYIGVVLDSRDPFSVNRSYEISDFPWEVKIPLLLKWNTRKTGGSELVSNGNNKAETWTSMDTIGVHFSRYRCSWSSGCRWRGFYEVPIGWGATRTDSRADISRLGSDRLWGSSRGINPNASYYAGQSQLTKGTYDGVQPFYGLSDSAYQKNSTDNFAVVVSKKQNQLGTTSTLPLAQSRINPAENEQLLGDRLTALATAQAYYSRPRDLASLVRVDNKHEYGNLYNPFWQTRLSESTNIERSTVLLLAKAM